MDLAEKKKKKKKNHTVASKALVIASLTRITLEEDEETIEKERDRVLQGVPIASRPRLAPQVLPSPQRLPLYLPRSIPIEDS